MLENYFWAKGVGKFLIKDPKLTFSQRTNIVNTIVDFLIETFGIEVTNVQKTLAAAATIILFPGLKFENGDETVSKNLTIIKLPLELSTFLYFHRNCYLVNTGGLLDV